MKVSMPELLSPITQPGPKPDRSSLQAGENIFGKILTEVSGMQIHADAKIQESLLGRVDLHETMLSLERASLGLKVLLQARNKMIQAYEELSRMAM